jgi:cytochrome c biogenesis protein CcmG/thiol:disulfide interchange protein DsbE
LLIDQQGVIRVHHIGDLNPRVWDSKFAPLYNELMAQQSLQFTPRQTESQP